MSKDEFYRHLAKDAADAGAKDTETNLTFNIIAVQREMHWGTEYILSQPAASTQAISAQMKDEYERSKKEKDKNLKFKK
jgi:hypothetical protein